MNTTPTPDKKLTPVAELIDRIKPLIGKYGIEADAVITTVIEEATSLLPAEREMVGKARVTAPLLVTSENDVYEEEANELDCSKAEIYNVKPKNDMQCG